MRASTGGSFARSFKHAVLLIGPRCGTEELETKSMQNAAGHSSTIFYNIWVPRSGIQCRELRQAGGVGISEPGLPANAEAPSI